MKETQKIDKKKYWLKLDKNFLKSPQMKVIKSMPNGKDYIIFYLSLMLESIETVGHLRFTSLVPYNDEMLSAITDTNIDIVRSAVKIFCELGLMKIFDDGTIFLPDVPAMTGKESESAERVRSYRARLKEKENLLVLQCNGDVTKSNNNKDKDKDKDKEESKKESKRTFDELIDNYTSNEELQEELKNHLKVRKQKKGALTNRAIELSLKSLDKLTKDIPINDVNLQDEEKLKIVRQSILNGWIGFFEVKQNTNYKKDKQTNDGWDYIDEAFKQIQKNNYSGG